MVVSEFFPNGRTSLFFNVSFTWNDTQIITNTVSDHIAKKTFQNVVECVAHTVKTSTCLFCLLMRGYFH